MYKRQEPNITRALDGVNFSVEDGEFVAVVGTSGSGKSTLLHMMGGLDTPTSGTVIVRDKELSKMNDEQLTIFRRRNIGFIFQNYNLVPILNVYETIVLPVELDGDTAVSYTHLDVYKRQILVLDFPRSGESSGGGLAPHHWHFSHPVFVMTGLRVTEVPFVKYRTIELFTCQGTYGRFLDFDGRKTSFYLVADEKGHFVALQAIL